MDGQDFQYRNLIVWQKAMEFSKQTYRLVNQFPAAEKYALSDQVRRAAVSVPSNIAEGCGRASNRDYAHFLSIAQGSLYETMTQLELAQSLGYIESIDDIDALASEISRMLTSLIKKYHPFSNSNSHSNFFSNSNSSPSNSHSNFFSNSNSSPSNSNS